MRIAIVFDGKAWFVRRIRTVEHDLEFDHKVYRCDKHLGGPFKSARQAAASIKPKKRKP